jgi:hypothetical protein
MVGRLTLDQVVKVRVLAPQLSQARSRSRVSHLRGQADNRRETCVKPVGIAWLYVSSAIAMFEVAENLRCPGAASMAHAVSLAVPRGRAWGTTEVPLGTCV